MHMQVGFPDNYYLVLGIDKNAGIEEVKKAYRTKVKQFHPDISSLPNAQKLFIELTEAYEFILADQKEKDESQRPEEHEEPFVVWDPSMKELLKEEMEKLHKIAREEARRKYREYQNSKEYRTTQILSRVSDYLFFGLGFLVIITALRGLYIQFHSPDFSYISVFAAFLAVVIGIIMIVFPMNQKKLKK
jgi:curved DNA-binding protein CbpA